MLRDVRILDLADEKGSFCSRLLADLGASVIRIEQPGKIRSGHSSPDKYFDMYCNANKFGITLNPEQAEGRKTFLELVRETDVLVETFQPGYLETIGLDYETLRKENPGIIHAAISGFGQKGPGNNYHSCDLVATASGGQMYIMGDPSGEPQAPFGEQSYYTVSLFGAVQILLALRGRTQTGKGTYIDLSLQEAVASTLDHVMVRWFYEKTIAGRQGNLYGNSFFCILPCKDGHILLTLLQQWETLVELMAAIGMASDLTDPQWQNEAYRIGNISHIIKVVREWTKKHTAEELFSLGQAMRFPWAPLCSLEDVLGNPQLKARQFFIPMGHHDNHSEIYCPGLPCKFSSFPQSQIRSAPLLGEHNEGLSKGTLWPKRAAFKRSLPTRVNSRTDTTRRGVLTGVRVLDFTWMLAGPYATRILADCGAEVIKVQSKKTANGAEMNASGYFAAWNRNKRSVTLDLGHLEARDIILDLTAMSDIVVENFSPRVMSNWGLSYDALKKVKSDLIMASISAMGQTGPWRDYTGYGPTFHALSGLTAMTSAGGTSPVGLGHAYADTIIGLYSALAILTALKHKEATGKGQHIDISGYESVCALMGPALLRGSMKGAVASSQDYYDNDIIAAPYGCYRCAGDDKWCVIAIFNEEEWRTFCGLLGNPGWTRKTIFSTVAQRLGNRIKLNRSIEAWTCRQDRKAIFDLLQEHGITAGIVENAEDLSKDPCLTTRDFFVELTHPVLGNTISDRSALTFSKETTDSWKAAPLLGEDNRYVFMKLLGFAKDKFLSFTERGIIG